MERVGPGHTAGTPEPVEWAPGGSCIPGALCFCGERSNAGARRELVNKSFDPFAFLCGLMADG